MVKFIKHRELKATEKIKSCTISKAPSGKYYVSITVEGVSEIKQVTPRNDKILGLDYAMNGFYVSSEGEIANYPRYYRNAECNLILDRDINASINIRTAGMAGIAW